MLLFIERACCYSLVVVGEKEKSMEIHSGKWLVIAEKPSAATDFAKALGSSQKKDGYFETDQYLVTWAVGHILEYLEPEDLDPKYKRWLLQDLPIIPEKFEYRVKKGQSERLALIKSLAKRKDVVGFVNACDAGREGELIFREIYDYFEIDKPFKRLWLNSMTTAAIRSKFANLVDGRSYDPLADAARCRSESDWLIGMNATRALTKRLKTRSMKGVWSVGRVQTPTLAILVDREIEALKHRPDPYWTIEGNFSYEGQEYVGRWFDPSFKKQDSGEDSESLKEKDDRIFDKNKKIQILELLNKFKSQAKAKESRKESKEIAPQLFDLTTLQREANRKHGMSASRTLQATQRLYERYKVVTYPRTDSKFLPNDYEDEVHKVLKALSSSEFGAVSKKILKHGLLNKQRVFDSNKVSDHFAIIPTGEIAALEGDDKRIFELITKRFLAAFMIPAVWLKIERTTQIQNELFRTRAQDLKDSGWREVYGLEDTEDTKLPRLFDEDDPNKQVSVETKKIVDTEGKTKAPARFNEAKLLSLMEHCGRTVENEELAEALEERGIGTPATRADIIENLIIKEYVVRHGRFLFATVKGIRLVDILRRIPIEMLSKVELTGEIESDLRKVEKGQKKRSAFMGAMHRFATSIVDKAKEFQYNDVYNKDALGTCPFCKKHVFEDFWSYRCEDDKTCKYVFWKEKSTQYIDPFTAEELLKKGIAGPLEFVTKGGQTYETWLKPSRTKGVVFCHEDGTATESESTERVLLHEETLPGSFFQCDAIIRVFDNFYQAEFINPKKIEKETTESTEKPIEEAPQKKKRVTKSKVSKSLISRMPRILCEKEISLEEYKSFIKTGETPPIMDFKSRKGRPFAAALHLKENGNFEFKFVSRKGTDGTKATGAKSYPAKATNPKVTKTKTSAAKVTKEKAPKKPRAKKATKKTEK